MHIAQQLLPQQHISKGVGEIDAFSLCGGVYRPVLVLVVLVVLIVLVVLVVLIVLVVLAVGTRRFNGPTIAVLAVLLCSKFLQDWQNSRILRHEHT